MSSFASYSYSYISQAQQRCCDSSISWLQDPKRFRGFQQLNVLSRHNRFALRASFFNCRREWLRQLSHFCTGFMKPASPPPRKQRFCLSSILGHDIHFAIKSACHSSLIYTVFRLNGLTDRLQIASACLFLASKVEEVSRTIAAIAATNW